MHLRSQLFYNTAAKRRNIWWLSKVRFIKRYQKCDVSKLLQYEIRFYSLIRPDNHIRLLHKLNFIKALLYLQLNLISNMTPKRGTWVVLLRNCKRGFSSSRKVKGFSCKNTISLFLFIFKIMFFIVHSGEQQSNRSWFIHFKKPFSRFWTLHMCILIVLSWNRS